MEIDIDYLKMLLGKIQSSPKAYFHVTDLTDDLTDEKFIFHIQLLADQNYIVCEHNGSNDIGFSRVGRGQPRWGLINLRMHAEGHKFAEALNNETVWRKLKSGLSKELKSLSIDSIKSVSSFLLQEVLKDSFK